jgi:hypothetical protein
MCSLSLVFEHFGISESICAKKGIFHDDYIVFVIHFILKNDIISLFFSNNERKNERNESLNLTA